MFLIAGTKGKTETVRTGTFFCSREQSEQGYAHHRVKRKATLFFIPVASVGDLGEYVECASCGSMYDIGVLDVEPARTSGTVSEGDLLEAALRTVAAATIKADGEIGYAEMDSAVELLRDHYGLHDYSKDLLTEDLALTDDDLEIVLQATGMTVSVEGRAKIVETAAILSAVDGELAPAERALITRVGRALGLRNKVLRDLTANAAAVVEQHKESE